MKYKNKSKIKKKKRGGNFNLKYQYGGNTGTFPNMNNLPGLNIPAITGDYSHVQGNLDAMNNAVLMGQVTTGMSGLADLQNNPGIQKMNLAQATVNPNRGFGAPPFQLGGYAPIQPEAISLKERYNQLLLQQAAEVEATKMLMDKSKKTNKKAQSSIDKANAILEAADKAQKGYSDGSPYSNEKSIEIPGNVINMQDTSRSILGIPDIGETILMAPNSGSYNFPKATKVTEIPFEEKFQMGGGVGSDWEDRRFAEEVDLMKRLFEQRAAKEKIEKSLFNSNKKTTNEVNSVESEDPMRPVKSKDLPSFKEVDGEIVNVNHEGMIPYYQQRKSYGNPEPVNLQSSSKVAKSEDAMEPVKSNELPSFKEVNGQVVNTNYDEMVPYYQQGKSYVDPLFKTMGSTFSEMEPFNANEDPLLKIMGFTPNKMEPFNANEDPLLKIMGSTPSEMGNLYVEGMGLTRTEESKEDSNFLKNDKNFSNFKDYMLKAYGMGSFEDIIKNIENSKKQRPPKKLQGKNKKYGGKVKKYQMGGEVMQNEMPEEVSIQTEVGEVVLMADGSIVDVKAKKKHSQMSDSTVTDILPQGSYIASNDKSTFISKGLADSISLGFSKVAYDELDSMPGQPKELNFGSIFGNSSKLKPSDIARNIKKKYPLSDRKHDAFVTKTIDENKSSRLPYSLVLQQIAEKTKENKMLMQQQDTNEGVEKFQMGGFAGTSKFINKLYGNNNMGYAKRDNAFKSRIDPFGVLSNKPLKFSIGGEIASTVGSVIGQIINYRAKKKAGKEADGITDAQVERWKEQYNINEEDIQGAYNSARGNLKGSTAVNLMSTLAQDTYENREDLSQLYTTANSMRDSLPQHIKDQQLRQSQVPLRGMTDSAFKYSGNSGNAMANLSEMFGKSLDSNSNLQAQQGANSLGLYNNKRGVLLDLQGRDAMNLSNQLNNIRGNNNLKTQTLGSQAVNYLNQDTALNMSELGANLQNRGTLNAGLNAADANRMSALGIDVSAAGNVAAGFSSLGNLGSSIYNHYNSKPISPNITNSPYANPNYKFGQNQQPYQFGQNFNLSQNNSQPNMNSSPSNQFNMSGLPNFQEVNGQIANVNGSSYIPYYQSNPYYQGN